MHAPKMNEPMKEHESTSEHKERWVSSPKVQVSAWAYTLTCDF